MPLRRRIQYQGVAGPPPQTPATPIVGAVASSDPAGLERQILVQYQGKTEPVFVQTEITDQNEDKWHYAWSEPVRQRVAPRLAIALIAASGAFFSPTPVTETVTVDKWFNSFEQPVRQKPGLRTNLQQALAAPVLSDTQLTDKFESRWHQPWSEPVRRRVFATSEQQAVAFAAIPPIEVITADKWIYQWPEPIRTKTLHASRQQVDAFVAPVAATAATAVITSAISSQVIFKKRFIYQSVAQVPFVPPVETVAIPSTVSVGVQYESRTQYQAIAQPTFTPVVETVTPDKWIYPWSEPVRQKPGLRSALQQAFIAPVLADRQLTDTLESRWHQAWSEPVRFRRFPASEQQALAFLALLPTENITQDKWYQAWSSPVRQKPGLRASLQQASIQTVLEPNTQIINGFESRWHYAWSEPVRTRRVITAIQPSFFAPSQVIPPPVQEITTSAISAQVIFKKRFIYQSLAQAPFAPAAADIAIPSTVSVGVQYETRIQYQSIAQTLFTPTVEVITPDKWIQAWSEPVRFKKQLLAAGQQFQSFAIGNPIVSFSYYNWLTEPVRFKKGIGAYLQPVFTADTQPIPISKTATWLYQWSEPVRQKRGLNAWLQQVTTPSVPIFPNLPSNIPWFASLNEPVRLKIGLGARFQQELFAPYSPLVGNVSFTFSATEVNTDSAIFGFMVSGRPKTVVVSIKEIAVRNMGAASIEET